METSNPGGEANPVKRYLQSRNIGLCMCHSRMLGFQVVRSTKATRYLVDKFTIPDKDRIRRSEEHLEDVIGYPDAEFYLNEVQKYFFRHPDLRHLRVEQFFRYFNHTAVDTARAKIPVAQRTEETTVDGEEAERLATDDLCHRHFDSTASALAPGTSLACAQRCRAIPSAHRRRNTDLCVPRSAFREPLGEGREAFFQQRLLLGLPWHCVPKPKTRQRSRDKDVTWTFTTTAPHIPVELESFW